jgi:hypothetical protein
MNTATTTITLNEGFLSRRNFLLSLLMSVFPMLIVPSKTG